MAQPFSVLFNVESSGATGPSTRSAPAIPTAPQKAFPRSYHAVPGVAEIIDLGSMTQRLDSTPAPSDPTPSASGYHTPRTPAGLSRQSSFLISQSRETAVVPSFWSPSMNKWRVVAACLMNFNSGFNDSAPGALLPYIEKDYNIGYAIVSLIFITNAVGYIMAAFVVDWLRNKLGRSKTLLMSQLLMACGYVPIICAPPFPVVVASFFLLGFGGAITLSLNNVFCANLRSGTTMLGAMHGAYGIGGTISPLIATTMVTTGHQPWSRFYVITMCVAIFNSLWGFWSFWGYEAETSQSLLDGLERRGSQASHEAANKITNMLKAFKLKAVLLGSVFIFCYQGAEVSISGWVISFLISDRSGNPSAVGYVTAGFWGGITVGRLFISPFAHRIGERRFVYGTIIGAAVFELCVWLVPNVIGDAVAVALVGLLLGPVYPCATVTFNQLISRKDQVSGLGVISAFGSSGGALAPFVVGILAQAFGTFVLHPITIGLLGIMMISWFLLPAIRKPTE